MKNLLATLPRLSSQVDWGGYAKWKDLAFDVQERPAKNKASFSPTRTNYAVKKTTHPSN